MAIKISQCKLILDHLNDHGSITQREAVDLFGCYRLAARIKNLRDDGYKITTEFERCNNKTWAKYWLS